MASACGAPRAGSMRAGSCPADKTGDTPAALQLTRQQFDALVVGLPWQRLPEMQVICRA
jgi:transposase